jgi:hypothetical protein
MRNPALEVTTGHHLLKISDMHIARDVQRWILDKAGCIPTQQYYQDKLGWTKSTFWWIGWDLQQRVLSIYDINGQCQANSKVHAQMASYKPSMSTSSTNHTSGRINKISGQDERLESRNFTDPSFSPQGKLTDSSVEAPKESSKLSSVFNSQS